VVDEGIATGVSRSPQLLDAIDRELFKALRGRDSNTDNVVQKRPVAVDEVGASRFVQENRSSLPAASG
jgi:hypothetical protein